MCLREDITEYCQRGFQEVPSMFIGFDSSNQEYNNTHILFHVSAVKLFIIWFGHC